MKDIWFPAGHFLGAHMRDALERGCSLEWVQSDIIVRLKMGELLARGRAVQWRETTPEDDLLLENRQRVPGPVVEISAQFWDELIFCGGKSNFETGHFGYLDPLSGEACEYDDVQMRHPRPRLPSDAEIKKAALKRYRAGESRDTIAKTLRLQPGFESVTNEHVRALLKGVRPPGRPTSKSKS